jgi:hypothetical protein
MHVFFQIIQNLTLKLRHAHGDDVETLEHEWQTLAHMPHHELELRKPIEDTAANDSDHVNGCLDVPTPGSAS